MEFRMVAAAPEGPGSTETSSSGSSEFSEGTKWAEKMQGFLDHVLSLDNKVDDQRAKKIADIKAAIANGTYYVSSAEVARKMIDQMRDP